MKVQLTPQQLYVVVSLLALIGYTIYVLIGYLRHANNEVKTPPWRRNRRKGPGRR